MDSISVSIITPCYNSEQFLAETIESVLCQTFSNWEMLIVDDCSTDKSYEIASEYAKRDSRIKVYRNEKNQGAFFSRNFAIEQARGKYIAFLDSDDLWLPVKLEKQLAFMQSNDCDFCFSEYEWIDENSIFLGVKARVIKSLSYKKNLLHNWPGCLTVVYDATKLGLVQGLKKGNGDDYSLFLDALRKAKKAMGLNCVLAKYRRHASSISYNRMKMVKEHFFVLHNIEKIPAFLSVFYVITHTLIMLFWKQRKIHTKS